MCILRADRYHFLNYDKFLSLKVVLILAHSSDPDKMHQYYADFIWLFTVCQRTSLGVSSIQKVKVLDIFNFHAFFRLMWVKIKRIFTMLKNKLLIFSFTENDMKFDPYVVVSMY